MHLSLILTLASFHNLEPVEVVFATHGRPMADDQLLEGVDIFIWFPQTVPNLILGQLRMDSSLRCGSERFHSGVEIWVFYFLAQRCLDRLSGHTLRSPSQTLGMNRNPKRESQGTQSVPHLFYFSKVFIVFKGGEGLNSAKLALVVMIVQ